MTVTVDKEVVLRAVNALQFQHGIYERYLYEGTVVDMDELLEFAAQVDGLKYVIDALTGAVDESALR